MEPARAAARAELGFDFVMAQKVSRFIEPDRMLGHLQAGLAPELIERIVMKHVRPYLERQHQRATDHGDLVGDALTDDAIEALRELAAIPVRLDKRFLRSVVEQDAVRHLIREVTEETISRFLGSLKGGQGGGFMGSVGRGAFGLASSMGKALLGGLGPQVEAQLSRASSAFIDGSLNLILAHVVEVMASKESAQHMADMAGFALEGALELPASQVWDRVAAVPVAKRNALLAALPGVLAHNLTRPEVRVAIAEEVALWLAVEGQRTVGEVLGEAPAALSHWRAEAVRVLGPLVAEFAGSEAFAAWLARG